MSNIVITVNDSDISKRLTHINKQLAAPRQIMSAISAALRRETLQTFADEGFPEKWEPLKPRRFATAAPMVIVQALFCSAHDAYLIHLLQHRATITR